LIEARGLVKHYRSTPAVDHLSFDVRPGTVTGFLGPNGAGKSTTMRMIMGLDRPDAGQVRIGGKRYGDLRWPLREVGALLEAKACHPGRTARAHLTALAASNAIGRRRVEEVLAITGIEKAADRRAGKFSLGMSQRLGIAAAQGRTVLVSSHLISEMAHTADALIVIGQGRLLAQTTVARLSARGRSLEDAFFQLTDGVTDYSGSL
jgi:ABC-2 type transport system ATP-binding protein